MREVDVVIVGGGMVGASLALALAGTGLETLMIEGIAPGAGAQPSFDDRTTALGNASRRIFEGLGVWGDIAPSAAAIRTIHVSDAGRFGFARLNAREQGIDAFGYVVTNRVIGAALWAKLANAKGVTVRAPAHPEQIQITPDAVQLRVVDDFARAANLNERTPPGASSAPTTPPGASSAPTSPIVATGELVSHQRAADLGARADGPSDQAELIRARLIVAADGAQSSVRAIAGIDASVEDYDQVAMVANLATDRPHDGTAYERFTPKGPLALLPLFDGTYGVVWSAEPAEATRLLALDDATFLSELQARFGWRAGRFTRVGKRASYPLKLTRANTTTATRAVLIGNAAQALHPVAGQGFNLGLRDAAMLAEVLAGAATPGHAKAGDAQASGPGEQRRPHSADPGSVQLLARFERWRSGDRGGVIRFTDGLIKLFGDTRPGMSLARNFGLLLFDLSPPAKSALARVSAGFAGPTPRLARGLAIR